jgi:hypothetical protein
MLLDRASPCDAVASASVHDVAQLGPGILRCLRCRRFVTRRVHASTHAGKAGDTRVNPHGFCYTFGFYASAPGAAVRGVPTQDASWYPPHAWQLAVCRQCAEHLGWYFTSADQTGFFALITNRLREDED